MSKLTRWFRRASASTISLNALRLLQRSRRPMAVVEMVVREAPGFVTSRINAMIGNEAFYMLQEGVASAWRIWSLAGRFDDLAIEQQRAI